MAASIGCETLDQKYHPETGNVAYWHWADLSDNSALVA